jgi:hypothetical protein
MPENRWMHGKAAASPRSGAMWGSENTASVYVRDPRGSVEQRGAFPWDARLRNAPLAPQLGSGAAGRLGHRRIASSGRLLDRESAVRCPESQRERE